MSNNFDYYDSNSDCNNYCDQQRYIVKLNTNTQITFDICKWLHKNDININGHNQKSLQGLMLACDKCIEIVGPHTKVIRFDSVEFFNKNDLTFFILTFGDIIKPIKEDI